MAFGKKKNKETKDNNKSEEFPEPSFSSEPLEGLHYYFDKNGKKIWVKQK